MYLFYRIVLAVHIIAVISWMAGLLYIFRLYVYHAMETEIVVKERFKVMERKLFNIITLPASLVALLMGVLMLGLNPELLHAHWMHAKLFFVVLLLGVTHYAGALLREFRDGKVTRSHKFFRVMNEVPTLLMIIIVVLVIVRPF